MQLHEFKQFYIRYIFFIILGIERAKKFNFDPFAIYITHPTRSKKP